MQLNYFISHWLIRAFTAGLFSSRKNSRIKIYEILPMHFYEFTMDQLLILIDSRCEQKRIIKLHIKCSVSCQGYIS